MAGYGVHSAMRDGYSKPSGSRRTAGKETAGPVTPWRFPCRSRPACFLAADRPRRRRGIPHRILPRRACWQARSGEAGFRAGRDGGLIRCKSPFAPPRPPGGTVFPLLLQDLRFPPERDDSGNTGLQENTLRTLTPWAGMDRGCLSPGGPECYCPRNQPVLFCGGKDRGRLATFIAKDQRRCHSKHCPSSTSPAWMPARKRRPHSVMSCGRSCMRSVSST